MVYLVNEDELWRVWTSDAKKEYLGHKLGYLKVEGGAD
jgi:hypothetical protein